MFDQTTGGTGSRTLTEVDPVLQEIDRVHCEWVEDPRTLHPPGTIPMSR
ncbi:MAG: hypothetical protein U9N78_00390 [Actinomycetota bacterium]|nr:hypothetical protein [Actinomycetota bacterium]